MIRFGTLGAARIAPDALVKPCAHESRAMILAVAARDPSRAAEFAQTHGIPKVCQTYDELLALPEVNAIYIPLPISAHREWTLKALAAGKHVLCEKSFACNALEAQEMHDSAVEKNLVLMDAFHYRYHPVFMRAKEIFDSGVLGQIRSIEATFHIAVTDPNDIRMKYETAGGVTMDIGCYPISWVRHLMGAEPEQVEAHAITSAHNVDVALETRMTFPDGTVATTSGDMREGVGFRADIIVNGERGVLHVDNPVVPQMGHRITLKVDGQESHQTLDRRPTYAYQMDAFIDAVENGAPLFTDSADAVRQMQLIDRCYQAAGLPVRGA